MRDTVTLLAILIACELICGQPDPVQIEAIVSVVQNYERQFTLLEIGKNNSWYLTHMPFQRRMIGELMIVGGDAHRVLKRSLQRTYDAHKKRFKNQEILSDCYESALAALGDYKDYVEIIERSPSPEKAVDDICQQLIQEFSQKTALLQAFKKTVVERKLELEKRNKEIERALTEWQHSKKKALLTQQVPFLRSTYSLILTTLNTLHAHIAYVEAAFFLKDHSYLFVEERALEKDLSDVVHFKYQLDKLIRTKARVGERYPFRAYAQWVDHYYELLKDLKKELENYSYYEFQQPIVSSLKATYTILDILKKQIKVSPEYEAECAQYNAELLARAREDENRKLKEQLAHMKDELHTLKQPTEQSRA